MTEERVYLINPNILNSMNDFHWSMLQGKSEYFILLRYHSKFFEAKALDL